MPSNANQIKLLVKSRDIKGATCGSSTRCPIARAIRRQLGARNVEVSEGGSIGFNGKDYRIKQWRGANRFIDRFDNKMPVKPTSFTLVEAGA